MIQPIVTSAAGQGHGAAEMTPRTRATRALLACGVAAGPLYVAVALAQGLARAGFDLGHDDVSLLANGHLGWIQATNFLLTGLLVMAAAAGMRRVLRGSPGGRWAPVLLGVYGAALFAAGLFRADPADGFPPGTPPGRAAITSWHGMLHIASAGIGFLALTAACFVLAGRFPGAGHRGWATYSRLTGVLFLAGLAGAASGSGSPPVVLAFWAAVVLAWAWIAAVAARLITVQAA